MLVQLRLRNSKPYLERTPPLGRAELARNHQYLSYMYLTPPLLSRNRPHTRKSNRYIHMSSSSTSYSHTYFHIIKSLSIYLYTHNSQNRNRHHQYIHSLIQAIIISEKLKSYTPKKEVFYILPATPYLRSSHPLPLNHPISLEPYQALSLPLPLLYSVLCYTICTYTRFVGLN